MKRWLRSAAVALLALALACATSPLGRKQLKLFPDSEMNQMGLAAFDEMKAEMPVSNDPAVNAYVRCVADAIVAQAPDPTGVAGWETVVFVDDTPNAFALPGGRIGVHTGMLDVAETADQLAAVIGHEVGHVIARHGNERVSTAFATSTGLQIIQALSDHPESEDTRRIMGLLGLGSQVGILLPFSRVHEREADLVGQDLMARAGFDPAASVELWRGMAAMGGAEPPEFLSTHPSSASRIGDLQAHLAVTRPVYEEARAAGRRPACRPPR